MKLRTSLTILAIAFAAVSCGDDEESVATTGSLSVVTATTGEDIDADGYVVTVDGIDRTTVGTNSSTTIPDLLAGTYSVELADVALNCYQPASDNVSVTAGQTESILFDVHCGADNQLPVADAGQPQSVEDTDDAGSVMVTLDGSGSTDDGTIVSWIWSVNRIEIGTGETLTLPAPIGVHTVTLTVQDDLGGRDSDEVTITVEAAGAPNALPVADAGKNQSVEDTDDGGDETVTLDGSGSTDDGTIVSWTWSENSVEIGTGETFATAFNVGVHTVTLTVEDDQGDTDTDDVIIQVVAAASNVPPVADAGPNQTVVDADDGGDETVTLDGSGSTDSDGTIQSWTWSENSVEIGTGETLDAAFDVGAHTVTLTVEDDQGDTDTDDVRITVESGATNQPPTADAGGDQTLDDTDNSGYESVTLDGSGSTDSDGTIKTWNWSDDGETFGTGETLTVQFPLGENAVTLTVTDDGGATDSDVVTITVTGAEVSDVCEIKKCGVFPGLANQCQGFMDQCLQIIEPGYEAECVLGALLICNEVGPIR